MSTLDYMNTNVGPVSVGDLLAFDRLIDRLGDSARETIARKIAHEVGDAAMRSPGRPPMVHFANRCGTCAGDGSETRMFDANCPAAWAHRFVQRRFDSRPP